MNVYKNTSGELFTVTDDEQRAAYAWDVRELPEVRRRTTKAEAAAFLEQRAAVWSLVVKYLPLAKDALRRLRFAGDNEEMLWAVGVSCLISCVRLHDPTQSEFKTYARRALFNSYVRVIRRQRRGEAKRHDLHDMHKAPDEPELHLLDEVQYLMDGLDPHDRTLLILRYYREMTVRQIAAVAGVGIGTAVKLLREATAKARRRLES